MLKKSLLKTLSVLALSLVANFADAGSVAFDIELSPVGSFTATADTVSGNVSKKGEEFSAQKIVAKIADFKSGVDLRDQHMKEKYFESAKFATAELVEAKGKDGKFTGKLMVHGQTKPIEGTYEVSGAELTAKFKTTLSAWEIKKASYMGVGVVDDVEVTVKLPIK